MSKKLLNKTTNNFLFFSIAVLLLTAPVFYYVTDYLYIEETDETLLIHKEEFVENILPSFTAKDIIPWNRYNRNVELVSSLGVKNDTLFTRTYYEKLEDEDEPYRELNGPITIEGKPYTYVERINLIEKRDMALSTAVLFFLLILILLSGILIINNLATKKIWKPFYDTLNQIQGFEIDKNYEPQFTTTRIAEFNQLNRSLLKLIKKNTDIYNNQREFIENAAHELQTPLALFQSKIDSLSQLELSEEQATLIGNLNNDVARLNRLNKNLLLLSKIENYNFPEKESISINDFVSKNPDFFSEQAKGKNIIIATDFREILNTLSNPELTEVLVNNLFLNAIRHTKQNGNILISIAHNSLTFSNSGDSQLPECEKLFNRFTKANPSSSGNGLGLSIIKKIVAFNGWKISYAFSENMHNFKIQF